MPNIRSAAKRARQTKARTARNRSVRSQIRLQRRQLLEQLEAGENAKAEESLSNYFKLVDKAAKSSVLHKNAANRLKSRAAAKLAAK